MLYAFLNKGSFQDSVSLMLVSRDLSKGDDVNRVSIMMGTPANKDVFRETGMYHELLDEAGPNDICVVIDTNVEDPSICAQIQARMDEAFKKMASGRKASTYPVVHSLARAQKVLPDANLALISVAGMYAGDVAKEALLANKNVLLFSDNVSVEKEVELKTLGQSKGLIVMGPDCGTSIIHGAPLAFSNVTKPGPVGIVGASGTGIQEIVSQLAHQDIGITHAIGLGGRDLSEAVGGISAQMALGMLDKDSETKVVVFVSKPPAPSVRAKISTLMRELHKPVVALFLGSVPQKRQEGNVYFAYTLDEAARLAKDLVAIETLSQGLPAVNDHVLGLYTGGTLASESAMLLGEALALPLDHEHKDGFMLHTDKVQVIDLGDDVYTRGRPHPMIAPSVRGERIEVVPDEVGVLLMDVVLGFGGALDPAGAVVESLETLKRHRQSPLVVIATVTGTEGDPQHYDEQVQKLKDAGVILVPSTRYAVMLAHYLMNKGQEAAGEAPALLTQTPAVINIGLRDFANDLQTNEVKCVHYQWAPQCGGDERLQKLLALMK